MVGVEFYFVRFKSDSTNKLCQAAIILNTVMTLFTFIISNVLQDIVKRYKLSAVENWSQRKYSYFYRETIINSLLCHSPLFVNMNSITRN